MAHGTIKGSLKQTLIRNLVILTAFVIGFVLVRALFPSSLAFQPGADHPASAPAKACPDEDLPGYALIDTRADGSFHCEPSPELMFEAGECWAGQAPPDVTLPEHVVLTLNPGEAPRYLGAEWVGRALEQTFDGVDHGIHQVSGFCR